MEPISRRCALNLGGLSTAFVLAGGSGLLWAWSTTAGSQSPSTPGGNLPN